MFENLGNFFKRMVKTEQQKELGSKMAAKERLHLVLMQDRANVSADFLELMKQEIIDVIKKYIVVDEDSIDVRLTNKSNEDGTNGAPALFANIPIVNIKNDMMAEKIKDFEGVDFNKEMGISSYYETQTVVQESVQETSENNQETKSVENIQKPDKENENIANEENQQALNKEEEENVEEIFEEVDDDDEDDDVTFDDLLKAAEEADKKNSEENVNTANNTSNDKTKSIQKNKAETKDKRKKKN